MAEVRLEVELPHPPELVWRALTEARLLREWFLPTDFAARDGAEFTLEPGTLPGFLGPVAGTVTELVPRQRIVMRWRGEKLQTRVTWELTKSWAGCVLRIVQTGFIGAPATQRRRALRDTYGRLFAGALPKVLDRLAATAVEIRDGAAPPAGRPAVTTITVPSQRRAPANMLVGAWRAGRSLPAPGIPGPRRPPAGPGDPVDRANVGSGPARRRWRPAWFARSGAVPAWARAVSIGAAAAALAMVVLAAIANVPAISDGDGVDQGAGRGSDLAREAPGMAVQPGGAGAPPSPSAVPDRPDHPAGPGDRDTADGPADAAGSAAVAVPEEAGGRGAVPGLDAPETPDAPPEPSPPSTPALTAYLATSDRLLLGLGGLAVTVTVANPGPGSAAAWAVTVDVGGQDVTNVFGADYARDGSQAIFTPVDAELAAGAETQFSFDLPGLIAQRPGACTIDGNPCG